MLYVLRRWVIWLGLFALVVLAACQPTPVAQEPAARPTEAEVPATEAARPQASPMAQDKAEPEQGMQEEGMDEADMPKEEEERTPEESMGPDPALQQQVQQIYIQQGCLSCHGANYEGRMGPMLVGLPKDEIINAVRNGFPEAEVPMPGYSPEQLSDEELEMLATFLSQLTLEDIGLAIPEGVAEHLNLAWQSLQEADQEAVRTHLEAALQALPEGDQYQGLRVSLEDLVEDVEEENWQEALEHHLVVLVGVEEHDE